MRCLKSMIPSPAVITRDGRLCHLTEHLKLLQRNDSIGLRRGVEERWSPNIAAVKYLCAFHPSAISSIDAAEVALPGNIRGVPAGYIAHARVIVCSAHRSRSVLLTTAKPRGGWQRLIESA